MAGPWSTDGAGILCMGEGAPAERGEGGPLTERGRGPWLREEKGALAERGGGPPGERGEGGPRVRERRRGPWVRKGEGAQLSALHASGSDSFDDDWHLWGAGLHPWTEGAGRRACVTFFS